MHCSRRLRSGIRSRLGVRGRLGPRLGRAGVSPLLRHSPVRAPPPGDDCDAETTLPLPVPKHGPHDLYIGNWPRELHELEITALFHKYSIYPTHVHLHRKAMFNSYAFVELACAEDVSRAIDQLDGGKVMGQLIVVRHSKSTRRPRPADSWANADDDVIEEGVFSDAEMDGGQGDIKLADCWSGDFKSADCGPADCGPTDCGAGDFKSADCRPVDRGPADYRAPDCCDLPAPRPPLRPSSPSMPPLVMPTPVAPQMQHVRHHFSDRDEELYESLSRAKRLCSRPVGGGGSPPLDMTGDSGESVPHDLTGESGSGHQSARSSATHTSTISEQIRRRLHEPVDVLVANFPAQTAELDIMDLFGRYKPLRVRIMVNNAGQQPGDFTYAYVTVWSTMLADSAVLELDGRVFRGHHLVVEVRRS